MLIVGALVLAILTRVQNVFLVRMFDGFVHVLKPKVNTIYVLQQKLSSTEI